MQRTVVIFGAGATKACGGPLTNEILADAVAVARGPGAARVSLVKRFLAENFNVTRASADPDNYPPLPLVLSLVDTAIDRGDAFGADWPPGKLEEVRSALEYTIFAVLEYRLRSVKMHHARFLKGLYGTRPPESVTAISLNYDLIVDNSLAALSKAHGRPGLPDYGCDVATTGYRDGVRFGVLLKLHGSLNWLYCRNCHRLDVSLTDTGRGLAKALGDLYGPSLDLGRQYKRGRALCPDCETALAPVLITPTHLKDYRNPHIARVWYLAARALREAQQAIFVGYSMPDDDVEVIYLLKRGLANLPGRRITVVEYAQPPVPLDKHVVGRRYRSLFGPDVDWHPEGFAAWLADAEGRRFEPARRPRKTAGTARQSRSRPATSSPTSPSPR